MAHQETRSEIDGAKTMDKEDEAKQEDEEIKKKIVYRIAGAASGVNAGKIAHNQTASNKKC